MEREGIDFVESAQLACKEFTILHLLKNTVHKGIANSADYDRPMFFVSFSPKVENVIYENLIECDVKMITKDEVVE